MHIDKGEIVATLRSRGLRARADWVDRELPRMVDTHRNASLLALLDIPTTTSSEPAPAGDAASLP